MKDTNFRELVDRIKTMVDIVQVIESRMELNSQNMGLCPFHNDTKPSFSVNADGQYFHCFGCGIGGDVIRFVELFEHKTFVQVLRELGEKVGIDVGAMTEEDLHILERRRAIELVLEEAVKHYEEMLSPEVENYLVEERGLAREIVRAFRIGSASGKLRAYLIDECDFPEELCLEAGVLKRMDTGFVCDYFNEGVILPFMCRGQVVSLTCRTFDGHGSKYRNLPGAMPWVFNEGALGGNEIVIVEGIFDCLSLLQNGFNAMALHGVSLRPEYVHRLSRCDRVYICLDGDKAGREAAMKIGLLLGEKSQIIALPEGQDPNDYLRSHSAEEFKGLLTAAKTLLAMELESIPADTSKTELPQKLELFLRHLAQQSKPTAEAWLSGALKQRFGLNAQEVNAYRTVISDCRRESAASPVIEEDEDVEARPCAIFPGLIDVVEHNGQRAFLVKEDEELRIVEMADVDGDVVEPPARESIPWLLAEGDKIIEHYKRDLKRAGEADAALFDDLVEYHKAISELPGEEYYYALAAWDIHTYLIESTRYSPVICFLSVPERGKSRTGRGMIYVARRGIHVESLRDAYIVRMSKYWTVSICFDVMNLWSQAEKSGAQDVLLSRFEKGVVVPRVIYPDRGPHRDTEFYEVFGPTIIATNEPIHGILETRCITIQMPETNRYFENDVVPENALELKERLLALRARYMDVTLPDVAKPVRGRLGDILRPLLQIIMLVRPEHEREFRDLAMKLQNERAIEKSTSLEAELLRAILESKHLVTDGFLSVKMIAEAYNSNHSEKEHITPQRAGRKTKTMGFEKGRIRNGSAAIRWNEKQLERLCSAYGVEQDSETYETSESAMEWEKESITDAVQHGKNGATIENVEEDEGLADAADEKRQQLEEELGWKPERTAQQENTAGRLIELRELDLFTGQWKIRWPPEKKHSEPDFQGN